MLSYFMSPEYTISDKLVQVMYILSGLFCMYCGVRAWIVKANKHFLPTGAFWFTLGICRCIRSVAPTACQRYSGRFDLYPGCTEHGKTRQSAISFQGRAAEEL